MAGPWEKYQTAPATQTTQTGPWQKFTAAPAAGEQTQEAQMGMILPIRRDDEGLHFDSDAGILGSIKRSVMLPGDVMKGNIDPLSEEGIGRATEFGLTFGPASAAMKAGERIIPGPKKALQKTKTLAPSADDLYDEASRNFDAMRESGVDYASDAVKSVAQAMKMKLEEQGFDPEVAGKTHRILDKLATPPENSVANIKGIHSARKTFGKIARNFNDPTDQAAATQAIRGLDEFIGGADASSVVAGTASDAAEALTKGNANYAAASRSDLVTGIERAADLKAAAANSGANTGNTIRQRVASALLQPKQTAGYSPEEIAALEKIVTGTRGQNMTRDLGNFLGGGGGMGQMLATTIGAAGGATVGGGVGAAVGAAVPFAAGKAAKGVSNSLTRSALNSADDMIRMRSPLYEQVLDAAPLEAIPAERRAAIVRALLMMGQGQAQGQSGGGW